MIGLAFSGGKDSWACLWLNRDRLADVHVIWVNTGKNFPELLETVEKARAMCPNFHEVKTDRERQNAAMGIPSEVVPSDWTAFGQLLSGPKDVTVQSYLDCCFTNISGPLHATAKRLGVTELIRGQRTEDEKKGACQDGSVVDGIVYRHPIESWTTQQVLAYVAEHMPLPGHFGLKHSSMDCFDCTAYRKDSRDRIAYMNKEHPMLFRAYKVRADRLDHAIQAAIAG